MTAEDRGAGRSVSGPVDALVEEFRGFLSGERGLAPETVRCYGTHARAFLAWLPQPVDVALAELSAGLVTGYVVEYCRGRNTESAKAMVTALRSLLRFLHVTGRVPGSLTGAVPAVASWRLAGLPRTLSGGQVEALIEGCDSDRCDDCMPRREISCPSRRNLALLVVPFTRKTKFVPVVL